MKDFQVLSIGGVSLDKDARSLNPNEMSYALDSDLLGDEAGQQSSIFPLPSSLFLFDIPPVPKQYQFVRAKFVEGSGNTYAFVIRNLAGVTLSSFGITTIPSWTLTDFVNAINVIINANGLTAVADDQQGDWFSLGIYATAFDTPIGYVLTQTEDEGTGAVEQTIFTLQDFFTTESQFKPLEGHQIGERLFVFSKSLSGEAYAIGYASKDDNQVWTYNHLLITKDFNFDENKVIEIQSEEVGNGQFGIYWTDFNEKPKVLYTPTDMSSPLKYTMANFEVAGNGLFTLESIADQTNLQIQNFARIKFLEQLESGGNLESGTWFYYVQSGIGRNYSEWSAASEPITVFSVNTISKSAGAFVQGDKTPVITSKANKLEIVGINPKTYDTFRVAAVLNQGGVYSAILIGEYNTVEGVNTITHSGKENSIQDLDRNLLPPVSDVFLLAENIQVKKNRMNLANVEIDAEEDLSSVFSDVTLGQTRAELESVGFVNFESENLVRASRTNLTLSSTGTQRIPINNVTTPNFNIGGLFDIATHQITIGVAGEYKVGYNFNYTVFLNGAFKPTEIYILNETTGQKYVYRTRNANPTFSGTTTSLNFTEFGEENVTLAFGDVLSLFITTGLGGSTSTIVNEAVISLTRNVADYALKDIKVGEYQLPENIATKLGYMVNERYSFFGRVEYKTGLKGEWHPIGKYRFDNGISFPAAVSDADLTDTVSTEDAKVYSYGLTINGLDITSIKDKIRRIEIGRALCNPTILGTGVFIASNGSTGGSGGFFNTGLYTGNTDAATYGSVNNDTSNNRYFGMMLSPDWMTGDLKPQFQTGDKLIVYGTPAPYASQIIAGGSNKWGGYKEFFGYFFANPVSVIDIEDAAYTEFNTNSRVLKNDIANRFLYANLSNDGTTQTMAAEGLAMSLGSRINNGTSINPDYGVYYVQYYRPIGGDSGVGQYSDLDDTIVSTNTFIDIEDSTSPLLPEIQVFGGDTYTQKTYTKVLYNAINPDPTKLGTLTSFIGFYSQNKINQQLRFVDRTFTNRPFPFGTSLNDYMFLTYEAGEQFQIDRGYTWENPTDYGRAFNPKIPPQRSFKSRIYYTQQKVLNSLEDSYRIFLPNDRKDLAAKDGAIHGLYDVNDVMIAIQENRVSVLPYQSDVAISGTEVYIGNGGVYAQRENPISSFGVRIKSAAILAKNESGNVNVYWVSHNGNGLFRYGNDGIKNLSNLNGYRTWFLNNYELCNSEFDIILGFDQSRNDIFVTAKGWNRTVQPWVQGQTYTLGDRVTYGFASPSVNKYQTFERLTDIYTLIVPSTSSFTNPFDAPELWKYEPTSDISLYNYSTVIFNEKFNFFRGSFSLLPARYFSFNEKLIVPRGIANFNRLYDLFGGSSILQWLEESGTFKQGSFEAEWSVNKNGIIPKRFLSYGAIVGTDHIEANNPSTVLTTSTQTSDSNGSEFEFTNGQISEGVYTDHNDDPIISEFMKIRFISTSYYRLYSVVCQFYNKARTLLK
jgi:hypothetical protein